MRQVSQHALTAYLTLVLGTTLAGTLDVVVTNVEGDQGDVMVALYSDEKTYLDEKAAVASHQVEARAGRVVVSFPDLADGRYAVTLYHDANGNGKLDKSWLGVPKEGYGFGNNARDRSGPAPFSKAAVDVTGDTTIQVYLSY